MATDSTSIMRYHARVKSTGRLSRFVSRYPLTAFFFLAFGTSDVLTAGVLATWLVGVVVFILTSGELGYKRQPKVR